MKYVKFFLPLIVLAAVITGTGSCKKANVAPPAPPLKKWNRADTAVETANGVLLTLVFDEQTLEFKGTMVNQNAVVATQARVEVHTFDPSGNQLFEYGPTPAVDIQPGATVNVVLPAPTPGNFVQFSMHAETGSSPGSGG